MKSRLNDIFRPRRRTERWQSMVLDSSRPSTGTLRFEELEIGKTTLSLAEFSRRVKS